MIQTEQNRWIITRLIILVTLFVLVTLGCKGGDNPQTGGTTNPGGNGGIPPGNTGTPADPHVEPEVTQISDSFFKFRPQVEKDIASNGTFQLLKDAYSNTKNNLGGNGHTQTWDGKLFITTRHGHYKKSAKPSWLSVTDSPCSTTDDNINILGWQIKVFKPQMVTYDETNLRNEPVFAQDSAAWLNFDNAFSKGRFFEYLKLNRHKQNGVPCPNATFQEAEKQDYRANYDRTGQASYNPLAVTPNPVYPTNPFPSDSQGKFSFSGNYKTYEMYVYSQNEVGILGYSSSELKSKIGSDKVYIGVKKAQVIVENPNTDDAEIYSTKFYNKMQPLKTVNNKFILGLEPTITLDGRVLIWQGHPDNDGKIDYIMYSYNSKRNSTTGWSEPKPFTQMYLDKDKIIDNINGEPLALKDIAPISRYPIRNSMGELLNGKLSFQAAYPWIDFDGSNMTITTTRSHDGAIRDSVSLVGLMTQNVLTKLDGRVNRRRADAAHKYGDLKLFTSSPGFVPSMWMGYENEDTILPIRKDGPILPIFSSNSHNYSEVSTEDFTDGQYMLYYKFNEMLNPAATDFYTDRTADTSGHFNTGYLRGGAQFPQEAGKENRIIGVKGQAVVFDHEGSIEVNMPTESPLKKEQKHYTVEFFIKVLADLTNSSDNNYRMILNKEGSFNFILEESGYAQGTVFLNDDSSPRTGFIGTKFEIGKWNHVAMTFNGDSGELRTYLNGELQLIKTVAKDTKVKAGTNNFRIGNNGFKSTSGDDLYLLDDLKISNKVRSPDEIRISAYVYTKHTDMDPQNRLIAGLRVKDLHSPLNLDPNKVTLGHKLFFDEDLSLNEEISCSTCHNPDFGFTDQFRKSRGIDNDTDRNSTMVANRAFGKSQFMDGRASTLEDQAFEVVHNENELGKSFSEIIDATYDDVAYAQDFKKAFGINSKSEVTGAHILESLAEFQKSILFGNSRVDQYEAGNPNALDDEEKLGRQIFRGKGRCIACHNGSNYTDERFHTVGFIDDDLGRYEVTKRDIDKFAFKTPSLRDISRTGSYMHNGEFDTLEEVIEEYNKAVPKPSIINQDQEIRPLGLTDKEKKALVKFLKALDSEIIHVQEPEVIQGK